MSARKVRGHGLPGEKQQPVVGRVYNEQSGARRRESLPDKEVGRIRNERTPDLRQHASGGKQVIGVINNEQAPRLPAAILSVEREIGMLNEEKRD